MFNSLLKTEIDTINYGVPFYVENINNSSVNVTIKKKLTDSAPTLSIEASDDGGLWSVLGSTSTTGVTTSIPAGGKKYFRCTTNAWATADGNNVFVFSDYVKIAGNIMSLIYGSSFSGQKNFTNDAPYAFMGIFGSDMKMGMETVSNVVDASNLLLPASRVYNYGYASMFYNARYLTNAPDVSKAQILGDSAFQGMFRNCYALKTIPKFNITAISVNCFKEMFLNCQAVTTAPDLPARTLSAGCYNGMFNGTGLTTLPVIGATTLADGCFSNMFAGTSITNVPDNYLNYQTIPESACSYMFAGCLNLTTVGTLPATTIGNNGYSNMFFNSSNIVNVPSVLPATSIGEQAYASMFAGVTSMTTAPKIMATTIGVRGLQDMFNGCSSLTSIETVFSSWPSGATTNWVSGVANSGNFINTNGLSDVRGLDNIPSGWAFNGVEPVGATEAFYIKPSSPSYITLKRENSTAPALTVEKSTDGSTWTTVGTTSTSGLSIYLDGNTKNYLRCSGGSGTSSGNVNYVNRFIDSGVPSYEIGGSILSLDYGSDFSGHETTFRTESSIFPSLFRGCTHLTDASNLVLPNATNFGVYYRLFEGCTSLAEAPVLPSQTISQAAYYSLFSGCTSLNRVKCLATTNGDPMGSQTTFNWLNNVSATGLFIKAANSTWTTGTSGIPTGWTVINDGEPEPSPEPEPEPEPTPASDSKNVPFYVENPTNETMTVTLAYQADNYIQDIEYLGSYFDISHSTDQQTWTTDGPQVYNYFYIPANTTMYFRASGGNGWAKRIYSGSQMTDEYSGEPVSIDYDVTVYRTFSIPSTAKVGGNIASLLIGDSFNNNETISDSLPNPSGCISTVDQSGVNSYNTGINYLLSSYNGEIDLFIPNVTNGGLSRDYLITGGTSELHGVITDLSEPNSVAWAYPRTTSVAGTFIINSDYASSWTPNSQSNVSGYPSNWNLQNYSA